MGWLKLNLILLIDQLRLDSYALVIAVIIVEAYPFFTFSNLTCHLEDTGIGVFWLHYAPCSKEIKLGSSNQEASPSVAKNTRVVLVLCCMWKCVPTAISNGSDISEVPGCHSLWQLSSQWGSQKLYQGFVSHDLTACLSVFNLFLTQWIMGILSKGCKPDNFESHNSLKLSFTNIWGLCSDFVDCESFLESNSPDILPVCKTTMTQLILRISL